MRLPPRCASCCNRPMAIRYGRGSACRPTSSKRAGSRWLIRSNTSCCGWKRPRFRLDGVAWWRGTRVNIGFHGFDLEERRISWATGRLFASRLACFAQGLGQLEHRHGVEAGTVVARDDIEVVETDTVFGGLIGSHEVDQGSRTFNISVGHNALLQ